MNISRINSSRINNTTIATGKPVYPKQSFAINDFIELDRDTRANNTDEDKEELLGVLYKIFNHILIDGAEIIPRGMLSNKKTIVEASFKSPRSNRELPQIFLPLRGISNKIEPLRVNVESIRQNHERNLNKLLEHLKDNSSYNDLLGLIISASHEYGHYLSWQQGFHDAALRYALFLFHSGQIDTSDDRHRYMIFCEEATAWRFALRRLEKYEFTQWNSFYKSKKSSLKEYHRLLKLDLVTSIDILGKISMLDIDLT